VDQIDSVLKREYLIPSTFFPWDPNVGRQEELLWGTTHICRFVVALGDVGRTVWEEGAWYTSVQFHSFLNDNLSYSLCVQGSKWFRGQNHELSHINYLGSSFKPASYQTCDSANFCMLDFSLYNGNENVYHIGMMWSPKYTCLAKHGGSCL
jgi:hypothetical protein